MREILIICPKCNKDLFKIKTPEHEIKGDEIFNYITPLNEWSILQLYQNDLFNCPFCKTSFNWQWVRFNMFVDIYPEHREKLLTQFKKKMTDLIVKQEYEVINKKEVNE